MCSLATQTAGLVRGPYPVPNRFALQVALNCRPYMLPLTCKPYMSAVYTALICSAYMQCLYPALICSAYMITLYAAHTRKPHIIALYAAAHIFAFYVALTCSLLRSPYLQALHTGLTRTNKVKSIRMLRPMPSTTHKPTPKPAPKP